MSDSASDEPAGFLVGSLPEITLSYACEDVP